MEMRFIGNWAWHRFWTGDVGRGIIFTISCIALLVKEGVSDRFSIQSSEDDWNRG